jgi:hypothetical protein
MRLITPPVFFCVLSSFNTSWTQGCVLCMMRSVFLTSVSDYVWKHLFMFKHILVIGFSNDIVTCLRVLTTSDHQMWRARIVERRSDSYFVLFTTSLVATTIYFTMCALPCWFFILVGPLIAGFLVAALIWLLWSSLTLRLWSAPLISTLTLRLRSTPLFSSWRCVSDRLLWSLLTLRLWSVRLSCLWRCVSDRFHWSARFLFLTALK